MTTYDHTLNGSTFSCRVDLDAAYPGPYPLLALDVAPELLGCPGVVEPSELGGYMLEYVAAISSIRVLQGGEEASFGADLSHLTGVLITITGG